MIKPPFGWRHFADALPKVDAGETSGELDGCKSAGSSEPLHLFWGLGVASAVCVYIATFAAENWSNEHGPIDVRPSFTIWQPAGGTLYMAILVVVYRMKALVVVWVVETISDWNCSSFASCYSARISSSNSSNTHRIDCPSFLFCCGGGGIRAKMSRV